MLVVLVGDGSRAQVAWTMERWAGGKGEFHGGKDWLLCGTENVILATVMLLLKGDLFPSGLSGPTR